MQSANSAITSEISASHDARLASDDVTGSRGGDAADGSGGFDTPWIVSFIRGWGSHLLSVAGQCDDAAAEAAGASHEVVQAVSE